VAGRSGQDDWCGFVCQVVGLGVTLAPLDSDCMTRLPHNKGRILVNLLAPSCGYECWPSMIL